MKSLGVAASSVLATAALVVWGCTSDANGGSATDGRVAGRSVPAERIEAVPGNPFKPGKAFRDYWYKGVAELNRYSLEQARYGELRKGDAVLVFVTEDFLADKQVKLESPRKDRVAPSVLKANITKKFITGLYPYSMMTSVFTPVDIVNWPHSLKVATSSQEWCGNTFTQLNWLDPGYRMRQFSYFEAQGDVDMEITPDLLEDEVWTRLRLDPNSLPTGTISVLPGTMASRLRHTENRPVEALASRTDLGADETGRSMAEYSLEYSMPSPRTLKIKYLKTFPHDILSWSETYDDFGTTLTTTAVRTNVLRTDYWTKHAVKDTILRRDLGLNTSR